MSYTIRLFVEGGVYIMAQKMQHQRQVLNIKKWTKTHNYRPCLIVCIQKNEVNYRTKTVLKSNSGEIKLQKSS